MQTALNKHQVANLAGKFAFSVYLTYLVVALAGSALFIAGMLSNGTFFCSFDKGVLAFSDFLRFYHVGQIALSPQAHECYDPQVQLSFFNKLIAPCAQLPGPTAYCHFAPFVFLLTMPMAMLPLTSAYIAWSATNVIALGSAMALALRSYTKLDWFRITVVILAVLASFPSLEDLRTGQPTLLLAALICLFMYSWKKNLPALGGVALALLCYKPHYAIYMFVPVFLFRRRQILAWCIGTMGTLLAASAAVIGVDNVVNFPFIAAKVHQSSAFGTSLCFETVSLRGLASCFLDEQIALKIGLALMCVGVGTSFWIWLQAKRIAGSAPLWPFALSLLLCLITSPQSFDYDLTICAAVALTFESDRFFPPGQRWQMRLWTVLLMLYPLLSWRLLMLRGIHTAIPILSVGYHALLFALGYWHFKKEICNSTTDGMQPEA